MTIFYAHITSFLEVIEKLKNAMKHIKQNLVFVDKNLFLDDHNSDFISNH